MQRTPAELEAEYCAFAGKSRCKDKGRPPPKNHPPCYLCGSERADRGLAVSRLDAELPYDAPFNSMASCVRCMRAKGTVSYDAFCSLMHIVHCQWQGVGVEAKF